MACTDDCPQFGSPVIGSCWAVSIGILEARRHGESLWHDTFWTLGSHQSSQQQSTLVGDALGISTLKRTHPASGLSSISFDAYFQSQQTRRNTVLALSRNTIDMHQTFCEMHRTPGTQVFMSIGL